MALNKKKVWSLNYLNLEYYEQIPQMSNMVDNSIFLSNKSLSKKKVTRIKLPNEEILVV